MPITQSPSAVGCAFEIPSRRLRWSNGDARLLLELHIEFCYARKAHRRIARPCSQCHFRASVVWRTVLYIRSSKTNFCDCSRRIDSMGRTSIAPRSQFCESRPPRYVSESRMHCVRCGKLRSICNRCLGLGHLRPSSVPKQWHSDMLQTTETLVDVASPFVAVCRVCVERRCAVVAMHRGYYPNE